MYHWFAFQKQRVRKEVKTMLLAGMEREDLILLKFSLGQAQEALEWEHAGEFKFKGQKYDVVHRAQTGDTLFFWCWWDRKETELDAQLESLLACAGERDPADQQSTRAFQHFLNNLFIPAARPALASYLLSWGSSPPTGSLLAFREQTKPPLIPPPKPLHPY